MKRVYFLLATFLSLLSALPISGQTITAKTMVPVARESYTYPVRDVHSKNYSLENNWIISQVEGNFGENKPGNNDMVRGMDVKDGIMYFINRETASLVRVDGATGEMLDPIRITDEHLFKVEQDGEWVSDVLLPYNDIHFDQAGNCLIGGCTYGTHTFFIYEVNLETGVATEVIRERLYDNPNFLDNGYRFDAFGVYGDIHDDAVIMAADANSWTVYRWLIKDGVVTPAEQIKITLNPEVDNYLAVSATSFGTAPQIFPQDEEGSFFYVDGSNTLPMLFNESGDLIEDFASVPTGLVVANNSGEEINLSTKPNGMIEFQVGEEYFLLMAATHTVHAVPSTFALYKFADQGRMFEDMEPLWYFPTDGMGTVSNGCRTAVPVVEVIDDSTAKLYLYANNNGYACYTLFNGYDSLPMQQTDTIYFVNAQSWSPVNVYAWNEETSSQNATWPGVAAEKANYQVNGYDVYYFVVNQGQYTHCIFNNGSAQTDNLQWTAGKYYYNGSWWTYDELMNNVVQSTYTVVGSSGLLGTHWEVTDTTNNMLLLEDGTYQLIKTDVTLVAGTYEYKVVRDHSWEWCLPTGANQVLYIDKDGIYTVTFTLDLTLQTISATSELQQEAVVIPKVFLIGTMNDWDYTATELQLAPDSLTASVTIMLDANTIYDYQMVVDGNWFTSYDGTMTRDNCQNWQFEHIENTLTYASVYTDIAGEYTFVWNYADNTISVIYPDLCSAVKELDWYNGVKISQLQSSIWHKIDIASITEYAALTNIPIENDLWEQVNVSVEYYTSCDGLIIMQNEARFAVGVTNMNINFDEIMKYIVYMPNIDAIYLKISVEVVEYAYAFLEDIVCDGAEYVDPITGEAHVIMSSEPSSLYWGDTVQVHSTLDSIYVFYFTPMDAPEMLDEYMLEQIGAMPRLEAGLPVDTTGSAEAIMAYYNSMDTEYIADIVRIEWVEGANEIVDCSATTHEMTLLVESDCDYVMEIIYEFPVAYLAVEEINIEACGSYTWNGITYTESGEYYLTNEEGCIVEILYLTIYPIDDEITIETICYGETFLWEANGEKYTETSYIKILKENEYGCEITYILDLTVTTAPIVITDTVTICYGDSYEWIDGYYDETGVYETIIANEFGCDSIIATLHLTVLPEVPETIIEKTIYDGDKYTWHDDIYTEEGEYSITLQDINGCDSVVTLILTVLPIYENEWNLLQEIRDDLIQNNAWQTPWDLSTSVSSWRGVELYNGHIIEINLSSKGLTGTFPTKILQLPHLEYLSLANNQLTGDAFAKIQTDMTAVVAENSTFVSALTYLDISYNQFTGNVGLLAIMSKLIPNLSNLQANNNCFKDVIPTIPQNINVDLSNQDINYYIQLDLSNLDIDPKQVPTILLYDHVEQTYFTSPIAIDITNYSPDYTYDHAQPWGIMIDKTNDYTTCLNGDAYRGKNGDTLYLSYPYAEVSHDSYCRMTLSFEMGDANFVDGVNIADLQTTILYAFGEYNNCVFNFTAADTYTDNKINVQDLIRTVDILLAKADINTDSTTINYIAPRTRTAFYDAEIIVENNTIKLITNQPIAALQISATGDVQWLLNGIGMEQTTAHHSVVAYSLVGNYIPAGETIIGYCQGNVDLLHAELSNANAQLVPVIISGQRMPTTVEDLQTTDSEQAIYDVLGRKHNQMNQQGLYIIKSDNQYIKVYNNK